MTNTPFEKQPGNKGVPRPREGYQQRKVAHYKYSNALEKGWQPRLDDEGNFVGGMDWRLMEKPIVDAKDCAIGDLVTANYIIAIGSNESREISFTQGDCDWGKPLVSIEETIETTHAMAKSVDEATTIYFSHPCFQSTKAEDIKGMVFINSNTGESAVLEKNENGCFIEAVVKKAPKKKKSVKSEEEIN